MTTCDDFLLRAVYNNAVWCDTICRSHQSGGEFHETFWIHPQRTPIYYPNLVTLSPFADIVPTQDVLAGLLTGKCDYSISVKDSFSSLNLTPFGFKQLFQAHWIVRQALSVVTQPEIAALQWNCITSAKELLQWEEAWSQTTLASHQLFLPTLLNESDVSILAAYRGATLVAGAIANRTSEVVGLSNVFTPTQDSADYWGGLLDLLAVNYPGLHVVGYEQDEALLVAQQIGFSILGVLRVWIKEA